jgi:hypothetical protein
MDCAEPIGAATTMAVKRFGLMAGAVLVLLVSSSALPADAVVLHRERYGGTFSGNEVECGRPVHVEGTNSGVLMLKSTGGNRPPTTFDNYNIHEVLTDAGGDGYIIDQTGLYHEMRVRHVRGNIYRYTAHNVGQVFTIRTLGGKAVYRNRGLLEITFLMDTLGDSDYHNDVFIEDSLRLVRDAGQHPIVTGTDEEFCAAIDQAIRG